MEKGKRLLVHNMYSQKSIGLDPGFGSSNFGVCIRVKRWTSQRNPCRRISMT